MFSHHRPRALRPPYSKARSAGTGELDPTMLTRGPGIYVLPGDQFLVGVGVVVARWCGLVVWWGGFAGPLLLVGWVCGNGAVWYRVGNG